MVTVAFVVVFVVLNLVDTSRAVNPISHFSVRGIRNSRHAKNHPNYVRLTSSYENSNTYHPTSSFRPDGSNNSDNNNDNSYEEEDYVEEKTYHMQLEMK